MPHVEGRTCGKPLLARGGGSYLQDSLMAAAHHIAHGNRVFLASGAAKGIVAQHVLSTAHLRVRSLAVASHVITTKDVPLFWGFLLVLQFHSLHCDPRTVAGCRSHGLEACPFLWVSHTIACCSIRQRWEPSFLASPCAWFPPSPF